MKPKKYQIIKISSCLGAPLSGTDLGPEKIITNLTKVSRSQILDDIIDVSPAKTGATHIRGKYKKRKNLPEIHNLWKKVLKAVTQVTRKNGIPVILHGDDSVVTPEAWSLALANKNHLGIIYFDAHPDANTPSSSPSGYLYGMGVAHMIGKGEKSLLDLKPKKVQLSGNNIILIGQRQYDPGEKEFIKKNGITLYTSRKTKRNSAEILRGIKRIFEENYIDQIYVHFDQDVIDPKESGASLCRTPNGLTKKEFFTIIRFLKNNFNIAGLSVGNYLPEIDKGNKTLKIIIKFLKIMGAI